MFTRNNRLDYQLFFHTERAVRPLGWNRLTVIVCLSCILNYLNRLIITDFERISLYPVYNVIAVVLAVLLLLAPVVLGPFQSSRAISKLICKPLRNATSLCSPLVAVLMMVPMIVKFTPTETANWVVFGVLFLVIIPLTISRLRPEPAVVNRQVFLHRLVLNLCICVELVFLVFISGDLNTQVTVFLYDVYALVVLSFGNLQIPAAVTRVVLSLLRLVPHDYKRDHADENDTRNLAPSLNIFYGMVLGQGILYVMACMIQIFSFIPRRYLARHGGFRGQWGAESVGLYYAYALEKSMEGDALAQKNISLSSFALYCLNSDTPKVQLYGIRIMHCLLQREPNRIQLLSKLAASMESTARLIGMLGRRSPVDASDCLPRKSLLSCRRAFELSLSMG